MAIDTHKKRAGLLTPVFALRREGDLGIGDTDAVKEAIDFCAQMGFSDLQMLPINETGGDHSPYNTISSVSLEPSYITMRPEVVPGLSADILEQLAPEAVSQKLGQGSVNYTAVKKLKNELLAAAFEEFEENELLHETALAVEFQLFIKHQARWLPAYTLFKALMTSEYNNDPRWKNWKPEHRTYLAAEEWCLGATQREEIERTREFMAYVQWIAFRQWQDIKAYADSKKVRLMGDIPFGISRYSADTWANPQLFDLTWSGGAPPEMNFKVDPFTEKWGQNWGIPHYSWERHKDQNFSWWRQRVQGVGACFHGFRIDHVLGFFRIYSFPWEPERNAEFVDLTWDEMKQKTGGKFPQFLPGSDENPESEQRNQKQGEYLLKVILQAAEELGMEVVAEDLGFVPNYVRPSLRNLGIPGIAMPVFERDEKTQEFKPISSLPELALVAFTTHDFPPLATMYEEFGKHSRGSTDESIKLEKQRLMRLIGADDRNPPEMFNKSIHLQFINALMYSPCWLAVLIVTDVLGDKQRFNTPGTAGEFNWSERLEKSLSELKKDVRYADIMDSIRGLIEKTGRKV